MSRTIQSTEKILSGLENILEECRESLKSIHSSSDLEKTRITYLGRKGKLSQIMRLLPQLAQDERPKVGQFANNVKEELQSLLSQKQAELETTQRQIQISQFDHSLPGRCFWVGSLHPITLVQDEICLVFASLGYDIETGPEIENDFYNFEALNMPKDHPARDMQDTLYISDSIVLRTHTSPLQIRTMMQRQPPLAAIAPGKVYRRDSDLTHTPMFHQIEGFLVDKEVNMADLRGTLTYFAQNVFSSDTNIRFRPSFFPFTEPSAEVDISCVICKGTGFLNNEPCRVCKQTGWVEILGCGMIDPEVFKAVGYDPERYTGFAFGLGVERIAMLKYGIDDLRLFFENDLRFLRQFQNLPIV